jgi:hypothetical protein
VDFLRLLCTVVYHSHPRVAAVKNNKILQLKLTNSLLTINAKVKH